MGWQLAMRLIVSSYFWNQRLWYIRPEVSENWASRPKSPNLTLVDDNRIPACYYYFHMCSVRI
jgi:hypothetical protein